MRRNAGSAPTITLMSNQRGLSAFEALGIVAILVIAAVVLYPLIRSAAGIGTGATTGATFAVEGAAAEAPSDRMPMLAYIESAAEGEFFLFRRFHWGVMMRSYLEELGVYTRGDRLEAYKDPFEGVYLWTVSPNTGSEFLSPQGDPYRMPRSAEESLALFGNDTRGGLTPESGAGFGAGFAGGAQPFGFEQPGFSPQPGMNQPGMHQPEFGGSNPLAQPGTAGGAQPGYPLGGPGLDF